MNDIDKLVTIDEQIQIVKRARSLIYEPTSWVQGHWKCQLVKPDGSVAQTENGTQKYQYCVEGAMNQATYDVIGEERALTLGAVVFNEATGLLDFKGNEYENPTSFLGINDLAGEMYGHERALEFNDSEPGEWDYEDEEDGGVEKHAQKVHEGVLNILSTKLADLTRRKERAA